LVSLGFPENHEAVTDERDWVEFNPRLVGEIPLSQGTMNIAVLPAIEADEATAADARAGEAPAAGNQLKALLNRHVDEYDLRDGIAILDIAADNLLGGEFEADLSLGHARGDVRLRAVVLVRRSQARPRGAGQD